MKWLTRFSLKRGAATRNEVAARDASDLRVPAREIRIPGDNPIRRAEDDLLGRHAIARSFARQVLSVDAHEGIVVGVLGPWGSGKTSFVNLARPEFEHAGAVILDFNPWMFSGAEQLVERFFSELAAQLSIRREFAEIGKVIAEYGEALSGLAWLPAIGPLFMGIGGGSKILRRVLERRTEGVGGRRTRLVEIMGKLDHPIVVVLDDIDRLSSAEIREVFRLVRLTASFPNIVYIVAFDRSRVEVALTEEGVAGRDYLEKILQLAIDLPAVPPQILRRQALIAIESALSIAGDQGPLDQDVWPDLFMEIIHPFIRNMRDVRRYAAALYGTVDALDGQIAVADVLALEAIRTFLPDVFSRLHNLVEALTTTSDAFSGSEPQHLKASVESLIEASGQRQEVVRSMIERLFPAAIRHLGGASYGTSWKRRWLHERRVAHEDMLRLYLERTVGESLQAFSDAEIAFDVMADQTAFDSYLDSLNVERLEDVVASLEAFEDKFGPEHVVSGTVVLLNLSPKIPDRPRGLYDLDSRRVVGRVVYRLVRSLVDRDHVDTAVREILPELTSLSAKLELIYIVGYREGVGHKLASEVAARDFEKNWRSEVRSASVAHLMGESNLMGVLLQAKRDVSADEPPWEIPEVPELTLAILRGARSEVRTQGLGNRAIRRSPRLAWDALIELFGSAQELEDRIHRLKETEPEGEEDLLSLVDRYIEGWKPDELEE